MIHAFLNWTPTWTDFLLDGIRHGFKILTQPEGLITKVHCHNYRSATDPEFKQVELQIKLEINKGNYMIVNSVPSIVGSLGAIPKKTGGIRLIYDCSVQYNLGYRAITT